MGKERLRPRLVQLGGEGGRGDLAAHSYLTGRKWGPDSSQRCPGAGLGVRGMSSRGGELDTALPLSTVAFQILAAVVVSHRCCSANPHAR